jgi:PilZ domain
LVKELPPDKLLAAETAAMQGTMLLAKQEFTPSARNDRRRFQRVRLHLQGRYMLADGREFSCQITDMSPGGIALTAPKCGWPSERVIAYVDHLGRIEGIIARRFSDGFALSIISTRHKREKLAAQLTWLANRHFLPEQRRHPRSAPRNPSALLILPTGIHVTCCVIDISQSGAGVASDERPTIGSLVTIGKTAARVARYIEGGFAVEFIRLQHHDSLEENVTGR